MTTTATYSVSGMSCDHCVQAITTEVGKLADVESVSVDLSTKLVTVVGEADPASVTAAIDEAGFDVD